MFDELKQQREIQGQGQTDYVYRDPYEMHNSMNNINNTNVSGTNTDINDTNDNDNVFDEMSSPTYFLNNQLDEAIVREHGREQGSVQGSGEKDRKRTIEFSEQLKHG